MVISNEKTLRELVLEIPGAARIFEKYRIDYCCGGKHSLEAACWERGITQEVLSSDSSKPAPCNCKRASASGTRRRSGS